MNPWITKPEDRQQELKVEKKNLVHCTCAANAANAATRPVPAVPLQLNFLHTMREAQKS
jgi:hypothetical protein